MDYIVDLILITILLAVFAVISYGLYAFFITREKNSKRISKIDKSDYLLAEGLSDRGKVRKNNEDSFLIFRSEQGWCRDLLICAVADGMGGENYGEVASSTAIAVLQKEFDKLVEHPCAGHDWGEWLKETINKANLAVIAESARLKTIGSMGTTFVVALVAEGRVYVTNVGDSRAYLMRECNLSQITKDHSLVGIMVEKGLIAQEEVYTHPRRGELLSFIGRDREVEADLFEFDLRVGDTVLLCSDGLWEMVRDPEIADLLRDSQNAAEACKTLLDTANQAGGSDNITIVVMKAEDER